MAKGNFPACLGVTLVYEGGFTKDSRDPGNWTGGKVGVGKLKGTKFGISAASYPDLDIERLTAGSVQPIYEERYWKPICGDDLPFGIDLATFDFGVNSGPARAARTLQSVLKVTADGRIGPQTLKAVILADAKQTIQALCARRLSFLSGLATWATFKRGWSRRVADIEAKAVAMWMTRGAGKIGNAERRALLEEADKADASAAAQKNSAGGAAGGGTVAGAGSVMSWEPSWWMIAGVAALVGLIIAVLIIKARQNRDRAEAYRAVAQAAG